MKRILSLNYMLESPIAIKIIVLFVFFFNTVLSRNALQTDISLLNKHVLIGFRSRLYFL